MDRDRALQATPRVQSAVVTETRPKTVLRGGGRGRRPAPPPVLTIAGSDPSGGAGLQADLKTFHRFGVYGMAVPTLVTVQNTLGVEAICVLEASLVRAQLECVQADIRPAAAKTGALGSAATVLAVAEWAACCGAPLVVDPVLGSTHGQGLADPAAVQALAHHLLPTCFLVTPNLPEAAALTGLEEATDLRGMQEAAERIADLGALRVLIKGGHLRDAATDLLWVDGQTKVFEADHIPTTSTHGTGCTYSAAIAALLATGRPLEEAVATAKQFVTAAIRTAPGIGRGHGPLNHHAHFIPGQD